LKNCPKCGRKIEFEDIFLDDDDGGFEKYEFECPDCGYYKEWVKDTRR
jgi:endogenous inhibitor of DNA gyrase (YacG/DUF329 family)